MNLLLPRNGPQGYPARCDVCGHCQAPGECFITEMRTRMNYCGDCYRQHLFDETWWRISRAQAIHTLEIRDLHYLVEQIPLSGKFYRSLSKIARTTGDHLGLSIALKDDTWIGWVESAAIGWLRTIVARQVLVMAARMVAQVVRQAFATALIGSALMIHEMDRQREEAREIERRSRKPVQLSLPIAG